MRVGNEGCDDLRTGCHACAAHRCPKVCSARRSDRLVQQPAQFSCSGNTGGIGGLHDQVDTLWIKRLWQDGPPDALYAGGHAGAVTLDAIDPARQKGGVLRVHAGDLVVKTVSLSKGMESCCFRSRTQ